MRKRSMKKIYYNGTIITMRTEGEQAEALLTDGGIIAQTGSFNELQKSNEDAQLIDLQGKTLMPSFIDGHSHFLMAMQIGKMADLSDCSDFEEIIATLVPYAKKMRIGSKGVILGWGYDHNFLPQEQHPDKTVLDQVSADIPVCVVHTSGHMGCVNSAALKLSGINRDTPQPQGGRIGKDAHTQEPNGYLEEAALFQVLENMIKRMGIKALPSISMAEELYLQNGITTVQEGGATLQSMQALAAFDMARQLHVDVVVYALVEANALQVAQKFSAYRKNYHGHVKFGGCKMILDGSPQGKTAWMTEPYENSGEDRGTAKYEDDTVTTWIAEAMEQDLQVLAHCNGDAASDQYLRCYQRAMEQTASQSKDLRPVMIHCQTLRRDQMEPMKDLGMLASIFVGHVYYWGDIHRKNLGSVRGNNISPCRWALDSDLVVNFHQDMPVTRPNMLHSIWCAVNRISRTGKVIGEAQKISVFEAFRAASYGAAYSYFEEREKGTLEAGKKADMIVLDSNPFQIDPLKIKDIRVLETIKDGVSVYQYSS